MNFHDNKIWQQAYVALMELYNTLDGLEDEDREKEEEVVESTVVSAQNVASKIADGLSRKDQRYGKGLLFDAIGLIAVTRTNLAIAWGRGVLTDEEFKALDDKYQELTAALQK
jgi:four helix bundle protein